MTIQGIITSLEEFEKLINNIRERRAYTQAYGLPYRQEFYRGQLSADWNIKPSLTRQLKTEQQAIEAEKSIIQFFKQEITSRDYLKSIFLHDKPRGHQNDWAWLMQAQHYGVPTRMLDWTLKPEVALHFSVDNAAMDNIDGQFLVLYYPEFNIKTDGYKDHQYYDIHPCNITDTWFVNPAFYGGRDYDNTTAETRRARQHGKFLIQPFSRSLIGLDQQDEYLIPWDKTVEPVIEKYIVPAGAKPQLRLDLIAKGWHGEFLYKDEDATINEIRDKCKKLLVDIVENSG